MFKKNMFLLLLLLLLLLLVLVLVLLLLLLLLFRILYCALLSKKEKDCTTCDLEVICLTTGIYACLIEPEYEQRVSRP